MDQDQRAKPGAILCVDDEGIILMHLLSLLRRRYSEAYRIEGVSDATSGMATISRLYGEGFRVILILSDWLMPGMNGDEFIRIVHEQHPDVKAIVISGKAALDQMAAAMEGLGVVGFLPKPLLVNDLYGLIDGIIAEGPAA